jgi:hypothetical protein
MSAEPARMSRQGRRRQRMQAAWKKKTRCFLLEGEVQY